MKINLQGIPGSGNIGQIEFISEHPDAPKRNPADDDVFAVLVKLESIVVNDERFFNYTDPMERVTGWGVRFVKDR